MIIRATLPGNRTNPALTDGTSGANRQTRQGGPQGPRLWRSAVPVSRPCLPHAKASPGATCASLRTNGRRRCRTHEAQWQRWRNRLPQRQELYAGDWPAHSRRRIAEVGACMEADGTCHGRLSVDHPTDDVLCTSHHSRREARRRAAIRSS